MRWSDAAISVGRMFALFDQLPEGVGGLPDRRAVVELEAKEPRRPTLRKIDMKPGRSGIGRRWSIFHRDEIARRRKGPAGLLSRVRGVFVKDRIAAVIENALKGPLEDSRRIIRRA